MNTHLSFESGFHHVNTFFSPDWPSLSFSSAYWPLMFFPTFMFDFLKTNPSFWLVFIHENDFYFLTRFGYLIGSFMFCKNNNLWIISSSCTFQMFLSYLHLINKNYLRQICFFSWKCRLFSLVLYLSSKNYLLWIGFYSCKNSKVLYPPLLRTNIRCLLFSISFCRNVFLSICFIYEIHLLFPLFDFQEQQSTNIFFFFQPTSILCLCICLQLSTKFSLNQFFFFMLFSIMNLLLERCVRSFSLTFK